MFWAVITGIAVTITIGIKLSGERLGNKTRISIGFIVFLFLFLMATYILEYKDIERGGHYWKSQGYYNRYRMPLEYPYELSMNDIIDYGKIKTWPGSSKEPSWKVFDIRKIYKQGNLVLGKSEDRMGKESFWFIFDCGTDREEIFQSEEEYSKKLKSLGFTKVPELVTLEEFWNSFWSNPKNWKGKKIPNPI
ncbi:MAG: hypothetical protein JW828_07690 [Sedimentisphaerales bacterium]|nr:hypothetical protein [Sedimentisphaerales bacterium]